MRTRAQVVVGILHAMVLGACSLSAPSDGLLMGDGNECPGGTKNCDGVCFLPTSPSVGCGADTCEPCEVPNAEPSCTSGVCSVGACEQGRADCDGEPINGCEADVLPGDKACDCHAVELTHEEATIVLDNPGSLGVGDGPWTLEAWLQREPAQATGGQKKHVFQLETAGTGDPTSSLKMAFRENYQLECTAGTSAETGRNLVLTEHVVSPDVWHHVACMRRENLLVVFVDGIEEGRAQCDATILAPDSASLGWLAEEQTRLEKLKVGPFRFSSTARYDVPFVPRAHWSVDEHTIVQYLVTEKLTNDSLADEAGRDNNGSALGCTALDTSPCSD